MPNPSWQQIKDPKPHPAVMADPDTLLGQLQVVAENTTPKGTQTIRPMAQPQQGWPIFIDSTAVMNFVIYTSVSGAVVKATIRVMAEDGSISYIGPTQLAVNATLREGNPTAITLTGGWLIGLDISVSSGPTFRGQCYVQCFLSMDGVANELFADYISTGYNPSWPNGRIVAPTEGPGYVYNVAPANPAPGTDVKVLVPTGARWKVRSIFAKLTTDANVATRTPAFLIRDSGLVNNVIFFPNFPGFGTGTTSGLNLFPGYPVIDTAYDGNQFARQPLPLDLILPAGYAIETSTANIQVGDRWSIPSLIVEEWIEP